MRKIIAICKSPETIIELQLKMSLINLPKPEKIDDSEMWMALMFPGEITTYHVSPKYNLPTAVARMSVGDSAMMKWNGIEYEASCILIGTEKKCERLVYKLVEGYMHPCELDIPPQLLDDHCRMCQKKISGKLAVLIHQLEHTVNTCPILLCGHNFKDSSRMENHLRRHVEGNIKIKLETDDEGCSDHLLGGKTKRLTKRVKKVKCEEDDEDSLDENGNERPKKEQKSSRVEKRRTRMDDQSPLQSTIKRKKIKKTRGRNVAI